MLAFPCRWCILTLEVLTLRAGRTSEPNSNECPHSQGIHLPQPEGPSSSRTQTKRIVFLFLFLLPGRRNHPNHRLSGAERRSRGGVLAGASLLSQTSGPAPGQMCSQSPAALRARGRRRRRKRREGGGEGVRRKGVGVLCWLAGLPAPRERQ